ncbi:PP2C family protein-serine/threonine phosphatase [Roseomonas marmotae]|uniref:SpoIIE family protein phosphatase n=1 Tax=Roseomonas marmotae TaxID=2768161 RepID=A0ABS3K756_9PROT|nr:SpoIIE family protein phosphatase [Roseomonas marmotae]MBO1073294.1 SpoIIE family protein phosphatase [Roseomonas marmotae]QTI79088.1 SpoIIE family protein phosphatase [Roseomonas marmotae]
MSGTAESGVAILVVDDSPFNRLLLGKRLAELGYTRITTATNGLEGLAAIEAGAFDVVLLDIEMPELDGIGVLERLHASGRREPPVIVISALTEMSAIVRCIELGAEDYLPKSFDPPLLRARLSAVLEKKRLRDLAAQRLQLLEAELESARLAQLALVPRDFAALEGHRLALHAAMVPARQVGGDLYDAMRLDDSTLLFTVADVAGKGAPAGLTMARTLGLIRAAARLLTARDGVPDPAEILCLANDDLSHENEEATFVTIALGVLDMREGTGRIAVAAHEAPLIYAAGQPPRPMPDLPRQPPLGAMEGISYRSQPFSLSPGQGLLLYSDGVTEAEDPAEDFFGRARLLAELEALTAREARPRAVVEGVFDAVARFAGDAPQADDITALGLRFG